MTHQLLVKKQNDNKTRKTFLIFLMLFLGWSDVKAQNNFNVGVGLGPALSFTSIFSADKGTDFQPIQAHLNFHLNLHAQYLFQNKIGIASGFMIATKRIGIKTMNPEVTYAIYLNSFSFPFHVLLKVPLRSTPYKTLSFLVGTNIEYQEYTNSKPNLTKYGEAEGYAFNMSFGSRISFKRGVMGKLALGLSFNYALSKFYTYRIMRPGQKNDLILSPKIHFLKIELIYFFLNKIILTK